MSDERTSLAHVLWHKVNRKKTLEVDIMETPLRRCLTTFDLTLLGIGHMVGAGIFVLTGTVVKDIAGAGTILSYFFAGLAALLSSLCYAEFGAMVPKAGSAYTYTYVTMGEFWAFVLGWNIILEYLLGVASVARAFSGSFDALFNGAIRNGTLTYVGHINVPMLSNYPDFIALIAVLVVMACVCSGAKISINFNSIFTIINLMVIFLIITVGLSYSDMRNWVDPERGGFLPYGFQGTLAGAATCFYAYIGFDGIAVAAEEAKNPERSLPIATCISMAIVTVLYMLSSTSLTLLVPYYDVDLAAPFPTAFEQRGLHWAKVVVAFGALFGIITSLTGSMFAMPRAVYSMASDGLLFGVFSYVHPRTQTPLVAIIFFGLVAGLFALFIDIAALVEFLSIGTLLSFTMVAAGVMILRYQTAKHCQFRLKPEEPQSETDYEQCSKTDKSKMVKVSQSHDDIGKLKKRFQEIPVIRNFSPETTTTIAVVFMAIFQLFFCILLLLGYDCLVEKSWWAILLIVILAFGIILCFCVIVLHEQNKSFLTFQMPLVPLLPAVSMFVNIAMMIKLSYLTWIRLGIWIFIGILIYLGYGMRNSLENRQLSAYTPIVSFGGAEAAGTAGNMTPTMHHPQAEDMSGARYDQVYDDEGQSAPRGGEYEGQYQGPFTDQSDDQPQRDYEGQHEGQYEGQYQAAYDGPYQDHRKLGGRDTHRR